MLPRSLLAALCFLGCARSAAVAAPRLDERGANPNEESALAEAAEDELTGEDEAHRVEHVESDGEDHVDSNGEEAEWAERLGPDSTLCADAEPALRVLMPSVFQDTPDLGPSEAAPPE